MKLRDILNYFLSNSRSTIVGNRPKVAELDQFFKKLCPQQTEHKLIRIGSEKDGGYLVPDDLDDISAVFSPGVAMTADFELYFANKGVKCFLADYSVNAPPVEHSNFLFPKKYLGIENNEVFMTLQSWVDQSGQSDQEMLLQMDIEGAEFGVLLRADSSTLRKFRIIIIEFHSLTDLYHKHGYELINHAFGKLLAEFIPVHIHPNNVGNPVKWREFSIPPFVEITFIRKDRVRSCQPITSLPHVLDKPCVIDSADFNLPDCWYK